MYKNNEGYADPTAGAAIKEATWMPREVHQVYIENIFQVADED